MAKLTDRLALVTSGQHGRGAAIPRGLVAEGAACIVNYPAPHEREEAVALVDELRKLGVSTDAMVADVAHSCAVQNLIIAVRERFGRLDIPVNNAGVNSLQTWEEIEIETWERTLAVNLSAVFNCSKAARPVMRAEKRGNIVNIASISAFIGRGNVD